MLEKFLITFHLRNSHFSLANRLPSSLLPQLWGDTSCLLPLLNRIEKGDEARWGEWEVVWSGLLYAHLIGFYCHMKHYNHTASWNSNLYLFLRFCWSGIQEKFSWWLWLRISPEFAVKISAGCSHLKAWSELENLSIWLNQMAFGRRTWFLCLRASP